jgi:hypothetical protein
MWAMEATRFFRLAHRLPAYQGVIRSIAEDQAREQEKIKEKQGLAGKDIIPIPAGAASIPGLPAGLVDFG